MYNYQVERPRIFTEEGQRAFIEFRDNVLRIIKESGAIRQEEVNRFARMGDSWGNLALIDRMVELGDLREINYGKCAGQHRIFVKARE